MMHTNAFKIYKTVMVSLNTLILFVITFTLNIAFAGNLVCEYEGYETTVPYTYDGNEPEVVPVSNSIFAHTENCDSLACDLYFRSFGQEDVHFNFSKAESVRYTLGDEAIRCQDTGIGAVQEDVEDALDSAERAIDKAVEDVEDVGRTIERGIKNIFR